MTRAVHGSGIDFEITFAHAGPPWLPIQRIAARAGLAWLSPSGLAIHPHHGPWISLRALLVAPIAGPDVAPTSAPPCAACPAACVPAFERARATLDGRDPAGSAERNWREWLAVRDACPIGRDHRFAEDQIRYGYTKDRAALLNRG